MKVYLARHGDYVLDTAQQIDVLTDQGADNIRRLANFLSRLNLRVAQVLHSDKHRAQQTAEIIASAFGHPGPMQSRKDLGPNEDVVDFAQELTQGEDDVLVVGHLPFLRKLVSLLLTETENNDIVNFQPGTLVCLEGRDHAHWSMDWVVSTDLV